MTVAEQHTDPLAVHGEGAVWWPTGELRWVDMLAGDVLSLDPAGRITRWHVGSVAALIRPRRAGGAVVVTEHDVLLADEVGGALTILVSPLHDPEIRLNEGGCAPDGALYCGTMAYDAGAGRGTLYRVDGSGATTVVLPSVTISNGLAWSPDGAQAYYVDTPTGRIDVFDADLRHGRPFAEIPAEAGSPDGLTVDAEGGVWVALWAGGAVRHYDAAGRLQDVIELPVELVTSCTFGGPRLDQLFITTSRHEQADPHPAAGAVFSADVGVRGLPVAAFAG